MRSAYLALRCQLSFGSVFAQIPQTPELGSSGDDRRHESVGESAIQAKLESSVKIPSLVQVIPYLSFFQGLLIPFYYSSPAHLHAWPKLSEIEHIEDLFCSHCS